MIPRWGDGMSHATSPSGSPYWSWSRCAPESSSCRSPQTQLMLVLFFSGHGVIVPSTLSHLSGFSSQHFSHGGSPVDKDANSPQINPPFGPQGCWMGEDLEKGWSLIHRSGRNRRDHPCMLTPRWNQTICLVHVVSKGKKQNKNCTKKWTSAAFWKLMTLSFHNLKF